MLMTVTIKHGKSALYEKDMEFKDEQEASTWGRK